MKLAHFVTYSAAAALIAGGALAMDTHPVTGDTLAETQEFTYRLLDQFPTLDPQLNEETAKALVAISDFLDKDQREEFINLLLTGVVTL